MKTSPETNELMAALAKAQGAMKNPEKNKTATIPMKTGGVYSFTYADLPEIYDTNRAALSDNGLSHSFGTSVEEKFTLCSCRLAHSSGQWMESEMIRIISLSIHCPEEWASRQEQSVNFSSTDVPKECERPLSDSAARLVS